MNFERFARGSAPSKRAARGLTRALLVSIFCGLGMFAEPVLAQVCAIPGKDGSTFSDNTYYPGVGTAGVGTANPNQVTLGTRRDGNNGNAKAVAVSDMVLVMQMQDASINATNTSSYGDGSTSRGYTALRSSGKYEFARVTAVSGSTLTLDRNLTLVYTTANATATDGQRKFQVIRVPQFSSLTISDIKTVTPWNGSTGGVFVLDVAGNLALSGTIDASGAGFRGGGSRQGRYVAAYDKLWNYYAAPWSSTVATDNAGAYKGEGIVGTPSYVRGPATNVAFTGVPLSIDFGYPTGTVNINPAAPVLNATGNLDTGSGAPANAGGGGSQHNSGGGGGSNAGFGGRGGNSFAFYSATNTGGCVQYTPTFFGCGGDGSRAIGGYGGVAITPNSSYLLMGGGGGAGENNNAAEDNSTTPQGSGGNGGGVIFVVANTISGSGNLRSNAQAGQPSGRDASGGGGAGGTIAIATNTTSLSVITQATGGAGGNSGLPLRSGESQGPAGGGGGGAVLIPTGATLTTAPLLTGGTGGVNTPATGITNSYGTGAGAGGIGNIIYSNTQIPALPQCLPVLAVSKKALYPTDAATVINASGLTLNTPASVAQPEYLITISNTGNGGAAGVKVSDVLPAPFTYAGPTIVVLNNSQRPTASDPGATATSLDWSSFVIPNGESITLRFPVNRNQAVGTFQNSASVVFLDPTDSSGTREVSPATNAPNGANTTYTVFLSNTGTNTVGGSNYASTSSTFEDIIIESDLSVTKVAVKTGTNTPQTVRNNTQSFDYLVTVSNLKAVNATAITVNDVIPAGLTAGTPALSSSPATPTTGASFASNTLTIPNLAAGQNVTLRLPVTVNSSAASTTVNTASLTASTPLDNGLNGSSTANNSAQATVFLNPVQLTKTVQKVLPTPAGTVGTSVTAKPGDTLEYCITASSTVSTAVSVNVSDTLLANQTFDSSFAISGASPSSFTSPTVTGTLSVVSSSAPKTMCFRTTVN